MHEFLCRLGHIQTLVNSVVCRSHRQQKPGLKLQTRREMHAGRSFSSLPARAAGQRRSSASWEKKNKPCGRRTNKRRLKETQSSDDLVSESEKLSGVFFEERLFLAAFMVPKWQSSTLQLYMKPLRSSRTYRVNSSMSCVWSGGKNFTTKRRMVFLGPADRQEKGGGAKGKTEGCGKVSVPLNQTHRRKRKENSDTRSEGGVTHGGSAWAWASGGPARPEERAEAGAIDQVSSTSAESERLDLLVPADGQRKTVTKHV